MSTVSRDVVVIGAGWSGLLTCKYMIQEGLTVVVLEKRPGIGGLWRYSDDPTILTVLKKGQCTSSACVTEISDFPMPDVMGDFPKHEQIWEYLNSYCDYFNIRPHIRLNCGIKSITKQENKWNVLGEDGVLYVASKIAVCCGVHQKANRQLEGTLFRKFTGQIMHSQVLKTFIPSHKGKTVLIFGGGETAADVVEEWHEGGVGNIIWSIPNGQYFIRKYCKLLPHREPQALDKASSRALKFVAPFTKGKPGLSWLCNWLTSGSLLAYQGHGIPEWRKDAEFCRSFINKSGHVLDLVDYKRVVPKGAIHAVEGKTVLFADGTKADVDVIIQCTGYSTETPFLPDEYQVPNNENYKYIFNVNDPSLAFIGYVRPVIGSIPIIAETQAWYVAKVFSGVVTLPGYCKLVAETRQDKENWSKYFGHASQRLGTLVEIYTYVDDIANKAGITYSRWELFKESPRDWLTAVLAPANASSLRLKNKEERDKALTNLTRRGADCVTPVHLLLILFCRIIWLDWWLGAFAKLKYLLQTNGFCRILTEFPLVRFVNWIWTAPKRWLFDNKSRP